METLEEFFSESLSISSPEIVCDLAKRAVIHEFPKGKKLFNLDEVPSMAPFLISGILRSVVQDEKGHEVTLCFIYERGRCVLPEADLHKPSCSVIEAITTCRMACVPIPQIEQLLERYPELLAVYAKHVQDVCNMYVETHSALGTKDGQSRYKWFLQRYENIADMIPDKYIATFLRKTPVTLSRTRRKIHTQMLQNMKPQREKDHTVRQAAIANPESGLQ